ncbi:MAG: MMPL family transporter [Gammaproteobacteria bacterium]|nr:MMPL family transporter [Gammaproteobacteria bacterium]
MHEFERNFGHWVLKNRWLVIIFSILLVLAFASGGRFLTFSTNYRIFFSADNPQLLAFDALEKTYAKNDNVMIVITPNDGNVFSRETLTAIEEFTKLAWQIPYSSRVDSLSNYQHTEARTDELIVADLIKNAPKLPDTDLQRIKKIATNEPLLLNKLVSPSGHVSGINITVQLPMKDPTKEVPSVMSHARKMVADIEQKYPHIDARLTGMVAMNNAFSEAAQGDMKSLVPLSFGLMAVALGLLLRGFTAAAITMVVIFFSIMFAMGAGGHVGLSLSGPSVTAPTIIMTVAVANSVHMLVTMLQKMRQGLSRHDAIVESMRLNLQPVFITSLTTALGFLTMNFSEVPPFQHLGNLVATGVGVSFILAVGFLPAMMSLLPLRIRTDENKRDRMMASFGEFVVTKRKPLFIGMLIFIIGLISFLPKNELNDVFVKYFNTNIEFRRDADYFAENLGGLYLIDYSLESGETGGISDPNFLADVEKFANWYRQQPEVKHVNTITDIMKRLNRNMHNDNNDYYRLPEQRDLAAQYLLLYEMSLPYGLDLNNQINVDKSSTRFTVTLETMSSNGLLALEKRADEWLKANTQHITKADGSGPSIMFAYIGSRNIRSMLVGTTVALILISMVLIIALRSLKIGAISMIPNLVPAAMGFGLWGLLVGEVGLALSVVTTMTLGIVVDDTVHFLSKYLRARREEGLDQYDAVRYAFSTVGRALLITSIVLVVGFLVLATSNFKLNSGMGTLTAIVITFALMADFLFLPPLLMKLDKVKRAISRA